MYTLFFNLLRDVQHNAMVAWSYQQIDSATFMQWQPANVQGGIPNFVGC
ncbi:hypothetical protein [Burkholderia vietnamiensis]|nr:hypothetical protein [Burkholderia vietnamiensis]